MGATLELTIRCLRDGSRTADARLATPASVAPAVLAANIPVAFDADALCALAHNPVAYGALLSDHLFAAQALREAWLTAWAATTTTTLQVRLNLDASDAALHALCWETLHAPDSGQPVALNERVRLVRTIESADLTPVVVLPRAALCALVVVANPTDLARYGLVDVDVDGEVARARAALDDIPTTILGDHATAVGRATLPALSAALRDAPPLVILIAHGRLVDGAPHLYLEQEDGSAAVCAGGDLVDAIARLTTRPLLVMLAACRSAGSGSTDTLTALGPHLARIGIPAVLGFQGDVALSTVKACVPPLIRELRRDGQIDRALAAARAALGDQRPWWQPVLWLRTDGRLWSAEPLAPPPSRGGITVGGNVGIMQVVTVTGGSVGSIIGSQQSPVSPPPPNRRADDEATP